MTPILSSNNIPSIIGGTLLISLIAGFVLYRLVLFEATPSSEQSQPSPVVALASPVPLATTAAVAAIMPTPLPVSAPVHAVQGTAASVTPTTATGPSEVVLLVASLSVLIGGAGIAWSARSWYYLS